MKKIKRWRGERGNRERMRVILEGAWKIEGRMYVGREDGPRRGKKSAGRGGGGGEGVWIKCRREGACEGG